MTEYTNKAEFFEAIHRTYDKRYGDGEFTTNQVVEALETIDERHGLDDISIDDIELSEYHGKAVEISIDDEETFYADPKNEYCVTHGNLGEEVPPEGPAKDGEDEDLFGIR